MVDQQTQEIFLLSFYDPNIEDMEHFIFVLCVHVSSNINIGELHLIWGHGVSQRIFVFHSILLF